jgi:hypothetical protein
MPFDFLQIFVFSSENFILSSKPALLCPDHMEKSPFSCEMLEYNNRRPFILQEIFTFSGEKNQMKGSGANLLPKRCI